MTERLFQWWPKRLNRELNFGRIYLCSVICWQNRPLVAPVVYFPVWLILSSIGAAWRGPSGRQPHILVVAFFPEAEQSPFSFLRN